MVKVLVADDEITSRSTLDKVLTKWGYDVVSCSTGYEALDILRSPDAPSLAILDWVMPDKDGLEVCRSVRAEQEGKYVYIIMLTARDQKEDLIKCMDAGADDFISKPFDVQELRVRLRAGKRVLDLQAELIAEREAFKFQATHDILTELPNRVLLHDRLKIELAHAKRDDSIVALLYLDFDRFKVINDTLGHAIGDKLLKQIASKLTAELRVCDTLARFGGDEFVLVLPQVKRTQNAISVAKRILEILKYPFSIDSNELHITTSIGIAIYPHNGQEADTLIKNADAAMYKAKEEGKNMYQLYTPSMSEKACMTMVLENAMHKALKKDEFILHYQPQVDLSSGKINGMEALIRWNHPTLGLVPPNKFIPIAEETGLIAHLGEWVLKTACEQNKQWQQKGYRPITMAVNLSARQFQKHNVFKVVVDILRKASLDPLWLELEVTESDIMKNPDLAIETLCALNKIGVKIAIDDFGTGYSSLSYLKRLPVDKLKIDRAFIKDITQNKDDAAITQAIIIMAQTLGLDVLAEGVETNKQLRLLQKLRCDTVQGFYFSRPIPANDAETLLIKQELPYAEFGSFNKGIQ